MTDLKPFVPTSQTVLAALAMIIIGTLCGCLIFHTVPTGNGEMVTFALGALAGALTVGGVHRFTNTTTKPPPDQPAQDPQP